MANFDELVAKANRGDRRCQIRLADHYLRANNPAKAAEWLTKAADGGDAIAQYQLAFLYAHGNGVEKNPLKASEYLKSSAESEFIPAQAQLGSFYIQGIGVYKDEQMGLFWTRKAAAGGNALAICNMGLFYLRGVGMSQNADKAREYLLRALSLGFMPAKDVLLKEAELLRNQKDDEDDKDYMAKIVAGIEEKLKVTQSGGAEGEKKEENAGAVKEDGELSGIIDLEKIEELAEEEDQEAVEEEEVEELVNAEEFDAEEENEELTDGEENGEENGDGMENDSESGGQSEEEEIAKDSGHSQDDESDDEAGGGFFSKVKRLIKKIFVD